MENHHELLGGKLQVYQRGNSRFWQCSASVGGKQWRTTTKQENLNLAQKIAQDWYLGLVGKQAAGTLVTEKTFQDAAEKFTREYEVITAPNGSADTRTGCGCICCRSLGPRGYPR